MGKLISVNVWQKNSDQPYASASTNLINADDIRYATNASISLRKSVPSASSNISSVLFINFNENNQGTNSTWLVQEALSTIASGS